MRQRQVKRGVENLLRAIHNPNPDPPQVVCVKGEALMKPTRSETSSVGNNGTVRSLLHEFFEQLLSLLLGHTGTRIFDREEEVNGFPFVNLVLGLFGRDEGRVSIGRFCRNFDRQSSANGRVATMSFLREDCPL